MSRGEQEWKREKEVFNLLNEYRKSQGKVPLSWCQVCAHYAEQHSQNMADKKVPFSHQGVNDRLGEIKKQVKGYEVGSENVAYSKPDMNPIEAWRRSKGHNANMLGSYTQGGIGHVEINGFHYYTAIFIRVGHKPN